MFQKKPRVFDVPQQISKCQEKSSLISADTPKRPLNFSLIFSKSNSISEFLFKIEAEKNSTQSKLWSMDVERTYEKGYQFFLVFCYKNRKEIIMSSFRLSHSIV